MTNEEIERETRKIAIEVHGGRPDKCTGWKAKMFDAAYRGAELGLRRAETLATEKLVASGDVERARAIAVDVLRAKLPRAKPENLSKLRVRIAGIRSGQMDSAPEVETARVALASSSEAIGHK